MFVAHQKATTALIRFIEYLQYCKSPLMASLNYYEEVQVCTQLSKLVVSKSK